MLTKIAMLWIVFAALMGFAVGGSVVSAFFAPIAIEQQQNAKAENSSTRDQTPEERHGTSEQAIATYTKWLMFFTGVMAVATIVLGIATAGLYIAGERHSERQLRAYVFGTYHSLKVTADQKGNPLKVMIQYEAKNWGQTPAHRIRNAAYVAKLPWPLPKDFVVQSPKWDDPRTVSLAPGQFMFQNDEIPYEVLSGNQRYYIVALIEYFDVFGQKRTTKLCASGDIDLFLKNSTGQPGGDDVPFEIAPQHNDAD